MKRQLLAVEDAGAATVRIGGSITWYVARHSAWSELEMLMLQRHISRLYPGREAEVKVTDNEAPFSVFERDDYDNVADLGFD